MFELAAKCTLVTKNQPCLQDLSDEILRHSKNPIDTFNVKITLISSLACSSKIEEALQLGLEMLAELGEGITCDLTEEQFDSQIAKSTDLFVRNHLENHDVILMMDTTKLLAMKVLARLEILAYFANPGMHTLLVTKMTRLSMQCGKLIGRGFTLIL